MTRKIEASPTIESKDRYINREVSWLEFNARVLDEALDETVPLFERLKFLSIFVSNLDEFFMVRVAGQIKMREEGILSYDSPDSSHSTTILSTIRGRAQELVKKHSACIQKVMSELNSQGIRRYRYDELPSSQKKELREYFFKSIFPVLTPLAYDAAHPFPFLSNLSLYLVLVPESVPAYHGDIPRACFVEIPTVLPRIVPVTEDQDNREYGYILLEELILANLDQLFIGVKFSASGLARVTRNLDYTLLENEVVDLLKSIKREMITRRQQEVVRLEVQDSLPEISVEILKQNLHIRDDDIYRLPDPFYIPSFTKLASLPFPELRYDSFNPRIPARLGEKGDIFSLISREDILVHHPYESFYTVTEFLRIAAHDPGVVAIKQTLYRTGGDSPIIEALIEAAENGKHVTAVVELKARFDETNNISWARRLEHAGVNVVFGFVDLKTHCKATLVVRKEKDQLERYAHLSTGNYNSITAKLYTDIGHFTKDRRICEDISQMFNLVTGISVLKYGRNLKDPAQLPQLNNLSIAPLNLRSRTIACIDREISSANAGKKAWVFAKMNGLVDRAIIDKLYEASQAGVVVSLIVRGICCLRPGVRGLSTNIRVISIIDRFLEHSRIYAYANGGNPEVFLSSADWMPRNMDRRVEAMWSVENETIKHRLIDEILSTSWEDNTKAREIQADGSYKRVERSPDTPPVRSQFKLIELVREEGIKSLPYDKAVRHNPLKGKRPVQRKKTKKQK